MTTKTLKLADLIKKGEFDWVNSNITEDNFPRPEIISTSFKLFHFGEEIASEKVVEEMKKEGYRPANIYELLSYDWNRNDWVVALGSSCKVVGRRIVPCLGRDGSERGLYLDGWDGDWDAYCRFLGVRNLSSDTKNLETGHSDTLTLESRIRSIENDMNKLKKIINL